MLLLSLSVMMFLEFAIWGAWSPVLASRLFGPLKMNGKQVGWIYGTIPLACIVAPLVSGQIADRWINAEYILAVCHLIGAVLLYIAAKKQKFAGLFAVMLIYAVFYTATLPLVNSLMFSQLARLFKPDAIGGESGKIFAWAPIAWVMVGVSLTGWRRLKGTGDGSDCLKFAAVLSLIMGIYCWFLPHTPPKGAAAPLFASFELFKNGNFILFMVLSFVVIAQLQFYFLGTAPYLQDIGVQPKNVPAVMTIAQAAQVLATWYLLGNMIGLGFKWTLAAGALSWLIMYLIYAMEKPKLLVIISMAFHGIAYVLFVIGGQIYVNSIAKPEIQSSAQSVLFAVTMGLGLFLGAQFTGPVMDHFKKDEKLQWQKIFLVPCSLIAACVVAFLLFFKG